MKLTEFIDAVARFGSMLSDGISKELIPKLRKEVQELCDRAVVAADTLLKKMEHVFNQCQDDHVRDTLAFSIGRIQEYKKVLEGTYIPELFVPVVGAMAYIGGVSQALEHHFDKELSDYEPA